MKAFQVFVAVVCLSCALCAAARDSHRIDILFDTSGSMRSAKASLVSAVQTLAWSLVLAAEQESISGVALSLAGFCENAEQIQVAGRNVFDATQWADAARALDAKGGCLAEEDGWNALDVALQLRPAGLPGHVLLITDEPRAAVHEDVDVQALLKTLYQRRLALDAVVAVELRCGDGRRALGLGQNGIGFVANDGGTFERCTQARVAAALQTTLSDYVSLAIASGGSVWDVNALRPSRVSSADHLHGSHANVETMAQAYTSEVLDRARWREASSIAARPLASSLRVMLGEPVVFDGQASAGSRDDLAISEWWWDIDGDDIRDYFGPNGTHVYLDVGVFPLTLHVVGTDGRRDSRTLWIDVYNP